jgi:organic radical activating enzyme
VISFNPDLIIEVTAACNRACVGCYAPNVVTNEPATELLAKKPELFISILNLNNAFNEMGQIPYLTTVRGGEPSLHPKLATLLLIIKRHSHEVMLETHGRWLLPENVKPYIELVEAIRSLGVIVKISFDKMHGLKKEDLQKITDFLDWHLIDYRIAITESTIVDFIATKKLCSWVSDEKIIFQPKVKKASDLLVPNIGVIDVAGNFNETLTNKFSKTITETLGAML